MSFTDAVRFNEAGLVPAIARDVDSGAVLMMAWMDREALETTVRENRAVYFSRSRGKLWRKGESSGHVQELVAVELDCDGDTVLLTVRQVGGIACHTGAPTCFYRRLVDGRWEGEPPP